MVIDLKRRIKLIPAMTTAVMDLDSYVKTTRELQTALENIAKKHKHADKIGEKLPDLIGSMDGLSNNCGEMRDHLQESDRYAVVYDNGSLHRLIRGTRRKLQALGNLLSEVYSYQEQIRNLSPEDASRLKLKVKTIHALLTNVIKKKDLIEKKLDAIDS